MFKKPTITLRDINDFPKPGIVFKDISPLLINPKEFSSVIRYMARLWKGKVDAVAGFDARGFIFASALAFHMKLPFVMLRKSGKLPGSVKQVSYGLEYGESKLEIQDEINIKDLRVLLVDDVLATGGTADAGRKLVELSGGSVAGFQFVIEIDLLKGRDNLFPYEVNSISNS